MPNCRSTSFIKLHPSHPIATSSPTCDQQRHAYSNLSDHCSMKTPSYVLNIHAPRGGGQKSKLDSRASRAPALRPHGANVRKGARSQASTRSLPCPLPKVASAKAPLQVSSAILRWTASCRINTECPSQPITRLCKTWIQGRHTGH